MVKKTGKFVSSLFICLIFILSGCTLVPGSDGDKNQGEESNSQYWLPTSFIQYDTEGNVKKTIEYQYDESGFINYVKGVGLWGGTEENPTEYIADPVFEEDTGTLYLTVTVSGEEFKMEYYFDGEDMLTGTRMGDRDVYYLEDLYEGYKEKLLISSTWLNDEGDLDLEKWTALSPVVLTEDLDLAFVEEIVVTDGNRLNDWEFQYKDETHEEERLVKYPKSFPNLGMASIWAYHSEKNDDGTVTTTVYYETGEVGEIVIWTPVTKKGFFQNICFDWDYNMGYDIATLEVLFQG